MTFRHPERGRALPVALLVLSFLPAVIFGQEEGRLLSLEDLYSPDPERRIDFSCPVKDLAWTADGGQYLVLEKDRQSGDLRLTRVEAMSGRSRPLYDAARMEAALAKLSGITADEARRLARPAKTRPLQLERSFRMNRTFSAVLLNHADDLFYYPFDSAIALRLTSGPEPEVEEEVSPDGLWVSFVRDHDLFAVEIATQRERPLTQGGSADLLFGHLDWVYQEEIYGRHHFKGYWWSPDSSRVAFLKLDESPVPQFTVVDHIPTDPITEVTAYPKAGDPNPRVELGVARVFGGETVWIDTSRYQPIDHLIVRVGWTPDSSHVVFQVQDREQTWLDLNVADPATGTSRTVLRETSPAWVDAGDEPRWLQDGSFLWLSERSGYRHIYHYRADGELIRQVTDGGWEVRALHGVDEQRGRVFLSATEHLPTDLHVYSIALDGGELARISRRPGTHEALFDPTFRRYLDTWSDFLTPPQVRLHDAAGAELRTVEENRVPALEELRLGSVEFLQVPTRDGFEMEALLIKPPDFDPQKKYPVLQYTYGGPHAPLVRNAWARQLQSMWHHLLAQRGYVIWMCDNRSASGKGIEPTWQIYQRLGELELRDIEDGMAWLEKQPWVDPDRVGIWGWSYGGFMTAYALTHSTRFELGIAGAPVTDWRLYDSVYTERYMGMPQNNPQGYEASSVIEAAGDLHGKLLIIHGTMDDNVHLQNSVRLIYALQKAGKELEVMIYPRSRHGVRDRELLFHLQKLMTEFVLENL